MAAKKKFEMPPTPPEVQKDLEWIASYLKQKGIVFEIKGYWVWCDAPTEENLIEYLSQKGFRRCKSGRNAGRYYYMHPKSPRRNSRSRTKPKPSKYASKSNSPKKEFEKGTREYWQNELELAQKRLQIDSGENHINIQRDISRYKLEISKLKELEQGKAKEEKELLAREIIEEAMKDVIGQPNNSSDTDKALEKLREIRDAAVRAKAKVEAAQTQTEPQPETTFTPHPEPEKPKPKDFTEEEVDEILESLFG